MPTNIAPNTGRYRARRRVFAAVWHSAGWLRYVTAGSQKVESAIAVKDDMLKTVESGDKHCNEHERADEFQSGLTEDSADGRLLNSLPFTGESGELGTRKLRSNSNRNSAVVVFPLRMIRTNVTRKARTPNLVVILD